jgi:hypothetical protein
MLESICVVSASGDCPKELHPTSLGDGGKAAPRAPWPHCGRPDWIAPFAIDAQTWEL